MRPEVSSKQEASGPPVSLGPEEAAYRDAWERVKKALEQDPGGEAVERYANELLALSPPLELQIGALSAKARRAYHLGDDPLALRFLEDAKARMLAQPGPEHGISYALQSDLWRQLVVVSARGGDPAAALDLLDREEVQQSLTPAEIWGLEALAMERARNVRGAVLAYAHWRAFLSGESADAGYAESKFVSLAGQLDLPSLRALIPQATVDAAADCLRVRSGLAAQNPSVAWVAKCAELPARIGILLPRSGKYSVFADEHFAAATAAIRVLSQQGGRSLLWSDSGSTSASAARGVQSLLADGAQVIVGPLSRSQVTRVRSFLAPGMQILLPGEGTGGAKGVAPSLESRISGLLRHAKGQKRSSLVAMVPQNRYGDRVAKRLARSGVGSSSVFRYPADATSFYNWTSKVRAKLAPGAALLVADSLGRTEMIVRQLRRDDFDLSGAGPQSPLLLLSAEGWSPEQLQGAHAVFEGAVVAPSAGPSADSLGFEREYRLQQGKAPGAQAFLLWEALRRVWHAKAKAAAAKVRLYRVVDEQLQRI